MAYDIKVESHSLASGERMISARYSDVISIAPEYLLREILSRMADKFVEEHYKEIEAHIDPKVVAACISAEMGAAVETRLMNEVQRVASIASEALRRAKRR